MTDTPLTREQIEAIRTGCEGVTPGPWNVSADTVRDGLPSALLYGPRDGMLATIRTAHQGGYFGRANAEYIERLSPDTVRALCNMALAALPKPGLVPVTKAEAAYGLLWMMKTTDKRIHEARHALRDVIGKDGQARGITWARSITPAALEQP